MRCVFCQNWDISHNSKNGWVLLSEHLSLCFIRPHSSLTFTAAKGWELTPAELADLMLKLQNEARCHNINLVTPEHVVPQVCSSFSKAQQRTMHQHRRSLIPLISLSFLPPGGAGLGVGGGWRAQAACGL